VKNTKLEPRYSGPNRTGICVCGHSWKEHHLGIVMNTEYYEATNEGYVPEECEHFGFNETGGLDRNDVVHCSGYLDRGDKKGIKARKLEKN